MLNRALLVTLYYNFTKSEISNEKNIQQKEIFNTEFLTQFQLLCLLF